jgi:hypothetical protein
MKTDPPGAALRKYLTNGYVSKRSLGTRSHMGAGAVRQPVE